MMSPDDFIGVRWSGWRVWEDDDLGLAAEHHKEGVGGGAGLCTARVGGYQRTGKEIHWQRAKTKVHQTDSPKANNRAPQQEQHRIIYGSTKRSGFF